MKTLAASLLALSLFAAPAFAEGGDTSVRDSILGLAATAQTTDVRAPRGGQAMLNDEQIVMQDNARAPFQAVRGRIDRGTVMVAPADH